MSLILIVLILCLVFPIGMIGRENFVHEAGKGDIFVMGDFDRTNANLRRLVPLLESVFCDDLAIRFTTVDEMLDHMRNVAQLPDYERKAMHEFILTCCYWFALASDCKGPIGAEEQIQEFGGSSNRGKRFIRMIGRNRDFCYKSHPNGDFMNASTQLSYTTTLLTGIGIDLSNIPGFIQKCCVRTTCSRNKLRELAKKYSSGSTMIKTSSIPFIPLTVLIFYIFN